MNRYELRPRSFEEDINKFNNPETRESIRYTIKHNKFDDDWVIWDNEKDEMVYLGKFETLERIYLEYFYEL